MPKTFTTPKKYDRTTTADSAEKRPKSINCIGYPATPVTLTETGNAQTGIDYNMKPAKKKCCVCKAVHTKLVY